MSPELIWHILFSATRTPRYTVREPSQRRGHGTTVVEESVEKRPVSATAQLTSFRQESGGELGYLFSLFLFGAALLTNNVMH